MTNSSKRKQSDDDDILESSIFDILDNEFQMGDIVWAKLNGFSWWPAFVYGCFSDDWKYVKMISKPGLPMKKQYFIYCFGAHFKHAWVHQACLHRYEGYEDFFNYAGTQAEQATTKRTEEQTRKSFKVSMSKELDPLWKEALKEAGEMSALSINLRVKKFERMIQRLLSGTKYSVSQQGTISTSLTHLSSNKRVQITTEPVEQRRRTFSFTSTRKETNTTAQSPRNQSKLHPMPTVNEFENDVILIKLDTPTQSTCVSLTTAICHFLDKGIPSLTIYEETRLVTELINHRLGTLLTLTDAQLYVEQYVIRTACRNFHHQMLFVQSDFFYDFLLKYPQVILKHRQWFEDFQQTLMPIHSDRIQLKKWQLATLLHAHSNLEEHFH